jgi:hypothetical protein
MRVRLQVIGGAAVAAALALTACSSSGGRTAEATPDKPAIAVGSVVVVGAGWAAIGLRTNADEQAEQIPDKPLTPAQRKTVAVELVVARAAAMQYPTVADATKAGYILAGKFTPGAGAHYISLSGSAASYLGHTSTVDPAHPLALIYDGTAPTSSIVGLMYGSFTLGAPPGFAGPNDHWHRHRNLCIVFHKGGIGIPFAPDSDVMKSQCDALHGMFMRESLWMVHTWVVPGWESPEGVFSHANIDLHCGDGTDHTDKVGFCAGSKI